MHPKRNISKLLLTYLISYALLLTLPTAVFVYVINTRIFSALQDQVAATAREGLRAAAERMEGRLDELSRVALGVTQNVKLSPYRLQENEYARIEGVAELRNFRYANDLIYDILYYLHAPRRFYSAFFAAAPAAMFDTAFSLKGRTSSEYTAFLELQDNPILLPAELARIPGQREIDLVQFIYPLLPGEPYATLVFLLDNEKLIRLIRGSLSDFDARVFVLNADRRVITAWQGERALPETVLADILASESWESDLDEGDIPVRDGAYTALYHRSNRTGLAFVSVIHTARITAHVRALRSQVFGAFLFVFFLGAVFIAGALYLNYGPIRSLSRRMLELVPMETEGRSELQVMNDAFTRMATQNAQLREDMDKLKPLLRDHLLRGLLSPNGGRMNSTLELSILLGPDSAGGAVFRIIALEAPGFGSPGVPLDQGEAGAWTFIPISQDVPGNALIFCAGDPGAQEDERRVLAAAIQEYAGACFACAGRPYRDIIEIGKSYTEALGLVSRVRSSGVPGVVFAEEYPDAAVDGEGAPAYPADELTRLSERIEGGDTGKIIESVDRILTSISDQQLPDFIARCIVYDIYNMVIATAVRKGIDLQSLIGPALAALTGGASLPLPVLAEELRSSCMNLCGRLAQEGSSNRLLKDILDYIRANCFDINFSVERTADAFGISAPHLSRLFKEYKNINITDHVWAIRLERAKELLATTSLGLHEIVVAVGYSDVSSFSRKFKQTVGMTPGTYRSTSPRITGTPESRGYKEPT